MTRLKKPTSDGRHLSCGTSYWPLGTARRARSDTCTVLWPSPDRAPLQPASDLDLRRPAPGVSNRRRADRNRWVANAQGTGRSAHSDEFDPRHGIRHPAPPQNAGNRGRCQYLTAAGIQPLYACQATSSCARSDLVRREPGRCPPSTAVGEGSSWLCGGDAPANEKGSEDLFHACAYEKRLPQVQNTGVRTVAILNRRHSFVNIGS